MPKKLIRKISEEAKNKVEDVVVEKKAKKELTRSSSMKKRKE